jgi:peptide/nickel transport system substrate-binding protein
VKHKYAKAVRSLLFILSLAFAVGSSLAEGNLRIAISSEAPSLDVHVTSSSIVYHQQIYASLIARNPFTGDFAPYLAKSWEVLDGGHRIRFDLRDDVVFHDGTPLNAEAVKITFDRLLDPEMAAPAASNAGTLTGADVLDEFTVVLNYSEPFAPALLNLSNAYFGIMSPTAIASMGNDFSQRPVSAGPFKVKEVVSGDRVVLERFDDYAWAPDFYENQGPALLDTMTFMIIPDDATQLLLLQTNGLDMAGAPPRDVLRLMERGDIGANAPLQRYTYTEGGVNYLGLTTCCNRITDNPEIRKAVALAVNRDEIVETALEGLALPVTGLYSPATWGYDPEMTGYPFDPEAARSTLENLGYSEGSSGFYELDGTPLAIQMWTYNTPGSLRVAQILQAQLADVGINLVIQQMESATLLGSTQRAEHDALLISYGWSDGGILSYFFGSDRLATTNRVHFSDPAVDELLAQGNSTVDIDARFKIYQELQRNLLDQAPWVPLYASEVTHLVRSEVKGVIVNPFSAGLLYHDIHLGAGN